ncbi:MAG TPA: DUF1501 domain-containing protein [Phycisphaerales bacterium]|nr:DUF1501 domain-containing protein [Phycisphaerales bacterium]HMP37681.1 DUF1501 domain-containing protein [Phycisphaerales bacterium]
MALTNRSISGPGNVPRGRDDAESGLGTLVVVFLRGGADGLSLVPPIADDAYHRARPTLRVRAASAIPVDDRFGLHPELRPLERHLAEGRLAIVHGAGSQDETRSHFAAQDFMERGGEHGGGWLARYLRLRASAGLLSPLAAVAVGDVQPESLRGAPTAAVMRSIEDFALRDVTAEEFDSPGASARRERLSASPSDVRSGASIAVGAESRSFLTRLAALYGREPGALGSAGRATLAALERIDSLRSTPRSTSVGYPAGGFGRGLRELATLMRAGLGVEVATIDMVGGGLGWDTHFVQDQAFSALARELALGLDAFWSDLGEHRARTTVIVLTEFGRRLRENSSLGTDHGAGSALLVLGEGLRAGTLAPGGVRADWQDLSDERLAGPGDVPVLVDYRKVLAELLPRVGPPGATVDPRGVFPGSG